MTEDFRENGRIWETHCKAMKLESVRQREEYKQTEKGEEAFLTIFGRRHPESRKIIDRQLARAKDEAKIEFQKELENAKRRFPECTGGGDHVPEQLIVVAENALCRRRIIPPGWERNTLTCRNCGVMPHRWTIKQPVLACPWCNNASVNNDNQTNVTEPNPRNFTNINKS